MTTKKSKILPIKVWLDEGSCWDNKPQDSKGYVEYVREDYHAQALLHVLKKGKEFGKKEMLEKLYKWLEDDFIVENYNDIDVDGNLDFQYDKFLNDIKKLMEE